ncbi:YtxH domain-containing protein [Lacihabitans sp. LS3-19]|uniref:YtxH domain-containing protein n=1 Tax=Lacihabitans sp. LS3-19 TaxID=2487335 RepID=UPI0020CBEBED|nr:YtxH domain-containing protein [Lacihabitans sp. LS3-19]MCP9767051.1 YtxH domain-containing protein [Lacihabitans sp. LS3-19]
MNKGKVVLGMVASLAVGTMVGLLFAPEKGSRLRRRIADKGEDYVDALKNKMEEFAENVNKKSQNAIHDVEKMISKATMNFEDSKKDHKVVDVNSKS